MDESNTQFYPAEEAVVNNICENIIIFSLQDNVYSVAYLYNLAHTLDIRKVYSDKCNGSLFISLFISVLSYRENLFKFCVSSILENKWSIDKSQLKNMKHMYGDEKIDLDRIVNICVKRFDEDYLDYLIKSTLIDKSHLNPYSMIDQYFDSYYLEDINNEVEIKDIDFLKWVNKNYNLKHSIIKNNCEKKNKNKFIQFDKFIKKHNLFTIK